MVAVACVHASVMLKVAVTIGQARLLKLRHLGLQLNRLVSICMLRREVVWLKVALVSTGAVELPHEQSIKTWLMRT